MADSGAELFAPHRVRVPLAGMPAFSGVRNSGNIAPKPWEDTDLPPSEWRLPVATFTDPARYAEFTRFILGLRVIPPIEYVARLDDQSAVEVGHNGADERLAGRR